MQLGTVDRLTGDKGPIVFRSSGDTLIRPFRCLDAGTLSVTRVRKPQLSPQLFNTVHKLARMDEQNRSSTVINCLRNYGDMVNSLLDIMQCVICLQLPVGPVRQCHEGHILCECCFRKVTVCPTCRGPILELRNRAVEQASDALLLPCANSSWGCGQLVRYRDAESHAKLCTYRRFKCPLAEVCTWSGFKPEVGQHLIRCHPPSVLATNDQMVRIPYQWGNKSVFCMLYGDEIFLIVFHMNFKKDALLGTVARYGHTEPSGRFSYRMRFGSDKCGVSIAKRVQPEGNLRQLLGDARSVAYFHSASWLNRLETLSPSSTNRTLNIEISVSLQENQCSDVPIRKTPTTSRYHIINIARNKLKYLFVTTVIMIVGLFIKYYNKINKNT